MHWFGRLFVILLVLVFLGLLAFLVRKVMLQRHVPIRRIIGSLRGARNSVDLTHQRGSITSHFGAAGAMGIEDVEGGTGGDAKHGKSPRHHASPSLQPFNYGGSADDFGENDPDENVVFNWDLPKIISKAAPENLKSNIRSIVKRPTVRAAREPTPTGFAARVSMVSQKSVATMKSALSWGTAAIDKRRVITFDDEDPEVHVYTPENSGDNLTEKTDADIQADWEAIQARFSAWSASILADDDKTPQRTSQNSLGVVRRVSSEGGKEAHLRKSQELRKSGTGASASQTEMQS